MKKIIAITLTSILVFGCTPRDSNSLYLTGSIKINANVINPRSVINVGDSMIFNFEVPDTVELNGMRIKVIATKNDGGNVGLDANKIIPTRPGGFSNAPSQRTCNLWANPGSLSTVENFNLANQNGKLLGKFYMIPLQKGVYFFEETQEGYIDLNDKAIKVRFSFNFGNINRNHQMLIDSVGAAYNFNLFLQDKISRGLEIYGFKVN